ncbi:unnamed protein product [Bursaphelenchus okinawaensis]|uniref:SH3 domain-containing protein n=1 Tax=Bursaphelenchus okinawaensis TaxID=465554 RepID=A0A811LAQ2_9BILA|nr:unnamed protein product [Bursaphelenchus okinawaensis]CAG9122164.1 unnamed protein product [Bursaphelenchus okinawaensis]
MPLPNGQQPLRIPQPPSHSRQNSALGQRYRHCATPSTSSLSSVTTFPAVPVQQPSVSSLPVYTSEPGRRVYPSTQSTSTLPTRRNEFGANRTNLERMSYNDLMDLAKRQQLQLQAKQVEYEDRRKQQADFAQAKANGMNVAEEVNNLRQQIRIDEAQLQRQANARREVEDLVRQNEMARGQLKRLENQYDATDQYIRQATSKVHTLRQQMDQLQARRAAAANAAIAQQRLLNVQKGEGIYGQRNENDGIYGHSSYGQRSDSNASYGPRTENDAIYGQIKKNQVRPQAQVGPYQIAQSRPVNEKPPPPSYDQVDAGGYHNIEKSHYQPIGRRIAHAPTPSYNENPWVLRAPAVDNFSIRSDSLKAAKRRSWAHVDPPHQQKFDDIYGTNSANYSVLKKIVEEQKKGKRQYSLASIFGRKKPEKKGKNDKKEISKPVIAKNEANSAENEGVVRPENEEVRVRTPQMIPREIVGMTSLKSTKSGDKSAENRLKFDQNQQKLEENQRILNLKAQNSLRSNVSQDRGTPTLMRFDNRPEERKPEGRKLWDNEEKHGKTGGFSQTGLSFPALASKTDNLVSEKLDQVAQKGLEGQVGTKRTENIGQNSSEFQQNFQTKALKSAIKVETELAPIVVAEPDSDKEFEAEPSPVSTQSSQSSPPEPPRMSSGDEEFEKKDGKTGLKCDEIVSDEEGKKGEGVEKIEEENQVEDEQDKRRLDSVSPPEDPKIEKNEENLKKNEGILVKNEGKSMKEGSEGYESTAEANKNTVDSYKANVDSTESETSSEDYEEDTVHSPKVVIETLTTDEAAMRQATNEIIEQMQKLTYEQPKSIMINDDDDNNMYQMEMQSSTEEISSNDESVSTSDELPEFDEITRPKDVKGILKQHSENGKPKKKMVFDPLVLFLDAALEGDMDLVKEKAAEIDDISRGSDEGITALHNAICASHIEVIRYLVASHADVNAQDADGWTPLHCAASCNNFPIAKMLIENGACVFAISLSDGETPSDKFEESIEGYGGCADFLAIVEKCMGVINGGKVYTAYSYEAYNDDELSFEAGEELKVLNKDTGEKNHFQYQRMYYQTPDPSLFEDSLWWLCENKKGEKGLVPRNFLGLFPIWKFVEPLNFKPFNLPSNELALNEVLKDHEDARRSSSSTLDPNDATNSTTSRNDDQNSQTSTSSLEEAESPPPLPQPEFDQPSQIRANA